MSGNRTIVEERNKNLIIMDVFSKLVQERIIFIDDVIEAELANGVIAQMLYLDSIEQAPISVYINSPGGVVTDGLAIYDIAKIIKSPIRTVCVGEAASMAAILMFMGQERCGLKHSRLMLHQISGGDRGKLKEREISVEYSKSLQKDLYEIVKQNTTLTNIEELFYFDKWFTSTEALECGLLTKIL